MNMILSLQKLSSRPEGAAAYQSIRSWAAQCSTYSLGGCEAPRA